MDINYDNINLDLDYDELEALDNANEPLSVREIGYPVSVRFYELSKDYTKLLPWHWHQELEIFIVNHGTVIFMTNDRKVPLNAGEGVVVNANVLHSLVPENEDANCSMYSVKFNPAFLFGYGDLLMSEKYMSPITESTTFKYLTLSEEDAAGSGILENINEVIAVNLIKKFGHELSTKAKLCDFWLTLLNTVTLSKPEKKARIVPLDELRSKQMISYIEEKYYDRITLDELAASANISKSECCRCFKRALNMTPMEYIMRYRIYKAASFIKTNDLKAASFSELAFNVGFNNASYFNKVFRQYLNCTPGEYKKKVRQDPDFEPFGNIF